MQRWFLIFALGTLELGCGTAHGPDANGQTHWLQNCATDKDCGDLSCLCGVCTAACNNASECQSAVGESAACRAASLIAAPGGCSAQSARKNVCALECKRDAECTTHNAHSVCAAGICSVRTRVGDAGSTSQPDGAEDMDSGLDGDAQAADAASSTVPFKDLTCSSTGVPAHVPSNLDVLVSDVSDFTWAVSKDVLTWDTGKRDTNGAAKIMQKNVGPTGSAPVLVRLRSGVSLGESAAADGSLAVFYEYSDSSVFAASIRAESPTSAPTNLALPTGSAVADFWLDADSVYWLETLPPPNDMVTAWTLTAWRSPRVPSTSTALGTIQYEKPKLQHPNVVGPVVIGTFLYVAINGASGTGQLFRASTDGSVQLTAFGDPVPVVTALATDGTDLLLLLDTTLDKLQNVVKPPHVARMDTAGAMTDVTETKPLGNMKNGLVVSAGRIYWTASQSADSGDEGNLWSIAADGSGAPIQSVHAPGSVLLARVSADKGQTYFALGCRLTSGNTWRYETHLMRLRP